MKSLFGEIFFLMYRSYNLIIFSSDVMINKRTRDFFADGFVIKVHKREPILEDSEVEGEKKPVIKVTFFFLSFFFSFLER